MEAHLTSTKTTCVRSARSRKGRFSLLSTEHTKEEVNGWFTIHMEMDFTGAENQATFTISLAPRGFWGSTPSLTTESQQRQPGLPTVLKRGLVTLLSDQEICKGGDALCPEQPHVLKLFGCEMAEFKVTIK